MRGQDLTLRRKLHAVANTYLHGLGMDAADLDGVLFSKGQVAAVPSAMVDAAVTLSRAGNTVRTGPAKAWTILGAVTGPRTDAPTGSPHEVPVVRMETYYVADTPGEPGHRIDVCKRGAHAVEFIQAEEGHIDRGPDANVTMVQAYDGGNNVQVLYVSTARVKRGVPMVLQSL